MRVPTRKSLCPSPLVCFSKSSVGLYPGPSLLESDDGGGDGAPEPPPPAAEEAPPPEEKPEEKLEEVRVEVFLRSCIRKPGKVEDEEEEDGTNEAVKRRVKWIDSMGKELVEVKEYEASHYGDSEDDGNPGCVCTIQ
ncbi:unnamed protein product [Spirodela intermedia]|uniref:Uncharacterized protein n=1 Tax=Spirodela intermedia TaxID=51605 RepID=A0A7I8KAQ5_SPIIN|nr:unnamed protein product [Spirodela intermedia]